jgi:hypothetical protein
MVCNTWTANWNDIEIPASCQLLGASSDIIIRHILNFKSVVKQKRNQLAHQGSSIRNNNKKKIEEENKKCSQII